MQLKNKLTPWCVYQYIKRINYLIKTNLFDHIDNYFIKTKKSKYGLTANKCSTLDNFKLYSD